jgi:hypothetical protein
MASANVGLVRSIFAASERDDFGSAEWAHPEIEYVIADGPDPGTWTGLADMAREVRGRLGGWEDYRLEAEEYSELDDECVQVLVRRSGRGKISGVELDEIGTEGAQLLHIRDDEVTTYFTWADRERAFADLGIAPETGSER